MRDSVSAILIHDDEIFIIERQNHLRAFPGYYSFPGGKVDKEDDTKNLNANKFNIEDRFFNALVREIEEELSFNLENLLDKNIISDICFFGEAITPDFNPHRFKNLYIKVFLKEKPSISLDKGEVKSSRWMKSSQAFELYRDSKMLVVPPMITILEDLARDIKSKKVIDPNLKYDGELEVPMINPVFGIKQFMPLSHTFPPANRTNCFLIGDDKSILIDPSPKDEDELKKLIFSINQYKPVEDIDLLVLSHHHPDHHEYSTILAREYNLVMAMTSDTHQRILSKYGEDYFKDIEIHFLSDGDILCHENNHPVKIIQTPGHDEGQISLIREDGAWCIVFDLIQTIGTVVVGDEEGDMKKYFDSLRSIIDMNPRYIFPSHGIGIGGINKLRKTLEHRLQREKSISAYLKDGLGVEDILLKIYSDIPQKLHPYARKTIIAHIDKIKNHGLG